MALYGRDYLAESFCGTIMGILLLFPFYRKVKKIVKLGSSKAKIEAGEYEAGVHVLWPTWLPQVSSERAEGTHNHP